METDGFDITGMNEMLKIQTLLSTRWLPCILPCPLRIIDCIRLVHSLEVLLTEMFCSHVIRIVFAEGKKGPR